MFGFAGPQAGLSLAGLRFECAVGRSPALFSEDVAVADQAGGDILIVNGARRLHNASRRLVAVASHASTAHDLIEGGARGGSARPRLRAGPLAGLSGIGSLDARQPDGGCSDLQGIAGQRGRAA